MYAHLISDALLLAGLCLITAVVATAPAWVGWRTRRACAEMGCDQALDGTPQGKDSAEAVPEMDTLKELESTLTMPPAPAVIAHFEQTTEFAPTISPDEERDRQLLREYIPTTEPVEVNVIGQEALSEYERVFAEERLKWVFQPAPGDPVVETDRILLECIVWSLLSNCVRLSPPGAQITLSLRQRDNRLSVSITDTGFAFEQDELPNLFKRVDAQRHAGSHAATQAAASNLSVVKEVAEVLGGSIIIRSQAGKGTTVTADIAAPLLRSSLRLVDSADPSTQLIAEQAAEISALCTKLEEAQSDLAMKDQELRWLARELKIARDQALAAAKTKSRFLSNMSHEIRTPLNGLIATQEMLSSTPLSAEQRELIDIGRESAMALLETINDLLDFSKMQSGKFNLDLVNFDLVSLIEGAAELLSTKARQKNLSLMTYVAADVPAKVLGDPARLRQVLVNLLTNAIKFTESGEVVCRVTLESSSDARSNVRFAIHDTGIGLSHSQQKSLFEPFTQGDGSLTRRQTGTGLGLSIARRLVELMGGQIGVESAEGKGSTFWFSIPFEHRLGGVDRRDSRRHSKLSDLRVLVIETNAESQRVMLDYCASWNIAAASVTGAREGLALMSRCYGMHKPFDVVIIDFDVSDMHAFTLARYVKNSPELSDTHLILMASNDEDGRGARALKSGFMAYLSKPVKQSQLFDCLVGVVDKPQPGTIDCRADDSNTHASTSQDERPFVLVVEDNPVNQRVATMQLEDLGCRVHIVNNGQEALDALGRLRYDLVLMDCAMPVMDGYTTTSEIRKLDAMNGRHTKIIAMTAHALHDDRERCLAAGMDDYLSKPVSSAQLKETLERWLKQSMVQDFT